MIHGKKLLSMLSVIGCSSALLLAACGDEDAKSDAGSLPDGGNRDGGAGDGAVTVMSRGQYLVDHVIGCADCHTPRGPMGRLQLDRYMAGVECFVRVPLPGAPADAGASDGGTPDGGANSGFACLHSKNLTNDKTGLALYTDAHIKTLIRDGLRPDQTPLHPVMPYYVFHNMKEEDLDAIVAYLRTIPPVVHTVPRSDELFRVPAAARPLNKALLPAVAATYPAKESAERGKYLATQAGLCVECHTQRNGPGSPTVLDETKFFQGGQDFGEIIPGLPHSVSSNITPDPQSGIGNWTIENIKTVLKTGFTPENKLLCPPMPYGGMKVGYGGMSDEDATDIANYLKSIAPAVTPARPECYLPTM